MAPLKITQGELLDALSKAYAAPAEAQTVNELVASTGWPVKKVRDAIGALAMAGRIEVHHVVRTSIHGHGKRVPAYTITPPPAKGKK